ncbi:MAG: response regulator [Candidatus Omnitrophica bacterium]|nr:response regulator [Candidatus Omnitrophota bacterium]
MNILYIDDNKESLEFVQELLEAEGFNVIPCQESHTSLKILDSTKIHCIVTDLRMPVLDGKDLVQIFAGKYPAIPVVVLTGHVEAKEGLDGPNVFAVLAKPIQADALINAIYDGIACISNKLFFIFKNTDLATLKRTVYMRTISSVLHKTKGNQVKASELLGISRQSLLRYIKLYGIKLRRYE